MGQEIVYCAKCQSRILGSDFEKGAAVRFESQAYCRACAPALEDFTPLGSRRLPRAAPRIESTTKMTVRRSTPEGQSRIPLFAGIGVGGLLALVLLGLALGGRSAPVRPPAEAREVPPPPREKPPVAREIRPPPPAPLPVKTVAEDLARLDLDLQAYLGKNEHANALMVLEGARKNRSEPGWAAEIERRTREIALQYEAARAKAKAEAAAAAVEKPPEPKPPEPKPVGPPAIATFIGVDTTTQGDWKGVYGADGYELAETASKPPAYARVLPSGHLTHTWAASSAEPRALARPDVADRIAACWFSYTAFDLEIDRSDGKPHRVALYCLDWDSTERAQAIEVADATTGSVLDRRSLASFTQGAYVVWDVQGRVRIRLTRAGIHNSVVSGVFFGPAGGPPVTPPPPVDPSPLLWLALEEGKGTEAADRSGKGNAGTLRGGAAWTDGKIGKGLRFDGRDDLVRIADSPSLKLAGTGLTATAWIHRQADQKAASYVVARPRGQFHLGLKDNRFVFGVETAEGARAVQGPTAANLQWTHLAATYDGNRLRLYVNGGTPIGKDFEKSAALVADARPVVVGEAFPGRIDDVRLYPRALSPAEIATLARDAESGLVGHWRFEEKSGSAVADLSTRRHAGTLENGAAWAAGKSGGAVSFDGVDDHVLVPDSPVLAGIAGQLTVAAWAYREADQDNWRPVVTRPRNPEAYEHFWLGFHNNAYNFGVDTPAGEKGLTGAAAPLKRWTHLAGTYDGAVLRMYVDGREVSSAPHTGEIRRESRPLCFGARRNPVTGAVGYAFRGLVDEVYLYDRALPASEIAVLASDPPK